MSNDAARSYLDLWRDTPSPWTEWSADTLAQARAADRPILLSIGFPASDWCQKMIREAYSDPGVVGLIETSYIPVVIDRDLRPDLNGVYMAALVATTGRGGWPITALVDHSGRPFWLATYVGAELMVQNLDALADVWDTNRSKIDAAAANIVSQVAKSTAAKPLGAVPDLAAVNDGIVKVASTFDPEWGGFGREPKFPTAPHLQLMLRVAMATGGEQVQEMISTTTLAMSAGGIYDQIGGGFHRFALDREWLVPRFEKTLFDQAQLVGCYHEAFTLWGNPVHRRVTEETIHYAITSLQRDDGGFSTGQAAESIGPDGTMMDGAVYTWTPEEIRGILANAKVGDEPVDADVLLDWYDITEEGHLNGRSIPNRRNHREDQQRTPVLSAIRGGLFELRKRRPQPATDKTVITEDHALMIRTLCGACNYFRRADWRASAESAGEFMVSQLRNGAGWHRAWRGRGIGDAGAGDYANVIAAAIRLSEATGHSKWIEVAVDAADYLLDNFFDPQQGGLWASEHSDELYVRLKPLDDSALPSPNTVAAEALLKLSYLTGEMRYKHQTERILQIAGGVLSERAMSMPSTLSALEMYHRGILQILIVPEEQAIPDWGPEETTETGRLIRLMNTLWRPNFVTWWGRGLEGPLTQGRDEPGAYLCREFDTVEHVQTAEELYRALTGREIEPGQDLAV